MNRILVLCAALVAVGFAAHAQTEPDTAKIEVKKSLGSVSFFRNDERLMPRHVLELTKSNPQAFELMKKAQSNNTAATFIGAVGGFLIGWPLGQQLAGGKANWGMVGAGAALVVVSIPLSRAYSKHSRAAVDIYNNSLQASLRKVEYRLGLSYNSVGLRMNFR